MHDFKPGDFVYGLPSNSYNITGPNHYFFGIVLKVHTDTDQLILGTIARMNTKPTTKLFYIFPPSLFPTLMERIAQGVHLDIYDGSGSARPNLEFSLKHSSHRLDTFRVNADSFEPVPTSRPEHYIRTRIDAPFEYHDIRRFTTSEVHTYLDNVASNYASYMSKSFPVDISLIPKTNL